MTRGLMVIIVFVAAVASGGQEREAYPGQRNHAEPPKGWTCTQHPNVPKSSPHHCECQRTCVQNTDQNGQPMEGMHVAEDSKCKVYCHPKSCACPTSCSST
jgi:hypothetical protein